METNQNFKTGDLLIPDENFDNAFVLEEGHGLKEGINYRMATAEEEEKFFKPFVPATEETPVDKTKVAVRHEITAPDAHGMQHCKKCGHIVAEIKKGDDGYDGYPEGEAIVHEGTVLADPGDLAVVDCKE